jgi:hypothetical protein
MNSHILWFAVLFALSPGSSDSDSEKAAKSGHAQSKCWNAADEVENSRQVSGQPPRLPEDLRRERVSHSVVTFRLCISEEGKVVRALTTRSSGNGRVDRFFQENLLTWRYEPRVVDGTRRPSVAFVTITLALLPQDSS